MYGKVHCKLLGNCVWPSTFGVLKHSLVCKACLKQKIGGNKGFFAHIDYEEIFISMRFIFWMHNDECMKGLERHKTGMFNEYVCKCFENARSYK